jgi:hypothetical protein
MSAATCGATQPACRFAHAGYASLIERLALMVGTPPGAFAPGRFAHPTH